MTTRALRQEETRQRVLAAATRLFRERGYAGAAASDIAKAAKVAHGTVFRVAPTKEALAVLAFAHEITDVVAAVEPRGALLEQLVAYFHALFRYFHRAPELSRAIVRSLVFVADEEARAAHLGSQEGFILVLEDVVRRAQARGEIAGAHSAREVADNGFSIYLWHLVQLLDGRIASPALAVQSLERHLALFLNGLAP